jgi:hypothetical protein
MAGSVIGNVVGPFFLLLARRVLAGAGMISSVSLQNDKLTSEVFIK